MPESHARFTTAKQALIPQVQLSSAVCSGLEFINADDELPVCISAAGDNWKEDFLNNIER